MSFNWVRFLDNRGIAYVTSGPNVSTGNVAIHCPMCGPADHSEHMSVSIEGSGWRCWRNPKEHSGKAPHRLIMALTRCTFEQAQQLAGSAGAVVPRGNFKDAVKALLDNEPEPLSETLELPAELRAFDGAWASKPYVGYLERRGIAVSPFLTNTLGMYYATREQFRGRIVFTVEDDAHDVKALVGRSISARADLRYLTAGDAKPYVLWQPQIAEGGNVLVVGEGPFDALKVMTLGLALGVRATCFFTAQPSNEQVATLVDLAQRYDRAAFILDKGNEHTAMRLAERLRFAGFESLRLPADIKDPGDIRSTRELRRILRL